MGTRGERACGGSRWESPVIRVLLTLAASAAAAALAWLAVAPGLWIGRLG